MLIFRLNSQIEKKNHISRYEKQEKGGREMNESKVRKRSCSAKPSVGTIKEEH